MARQNDATDRGAGRPCPGRHGPGRHRSPSEHESGEAGPRRTFFRNCLGGMGAMIVGFIGVPLATFLKLPKRLEVERAVQVPLSDLEGGQAIYRDYQGTPLVIVPGVDGEDEPRVFNASCSHLGCIVRWEHGTETFLCPCHGAVFDSAGKPLKGPTNQPLEKLGFEVKDGNIVIG